MLWKHRCVCLVVPVHVCVTVCDTEAERLFAVRFITAPSLPPSICSPQRVLCCLSLKSNTGSGFWTARSPVQHLWHNLPAGAEQLYHKVTRRDTLKSEDGNRGQINAEYVSQKRFPSFWLKMSNHQVNVWRIVLSVNKCAKCMNVSLFKHAQKESGNTVT